MAISEAYDSLGTIENWSKEGKKELENEVHNHLEAQEELLKEQMEREVRNSAYESNIAIHNKPSGNLFRDTEKTHQRKSEPGNYDRQENWRYPRRVRRPRQEQKNNTVTDKMGNCATDSTNRRTWNTILSGKEEIRTTTLTFFKGGSNSQRPSQRIETHEFYKPQPARHRLGTETD